jgi:hypothetical protein
MDDFRELRDPDSHALVRGRALVSMGAVFSALMAGCWDGESPG